MFSKLLKHEWKANAGLLGILSLCALGAGVMGVLVIQAMGYLSQIDTGDDSTGVALGYTGLVSIIFFIVLGLVAYFLAVQFINVFRFYKSRFTDEGYLTFTLPVNVHQIFWSSFLNILVWVAISALVVLVSVLLMLFVGTGVLMETLMDAGQGLGGTMEDILIEEPGYVSYVWLSLVSGIVSVLYFIFMVMTSITIGSVLAKKHKILASVGMYYAINMVVGIVESVLTVFPTMLEMAAFIYDSGYYTYGNITMVITIVLQLGLCIVGYFISTSLMKNRLNLP